MDGYERLMVGCVIFIPIIAVLLVAAWKNWHGKWLAFSDISYIAGEKPESLQRRKGRRGALVNLVWVVAFVGILGIAAFSALSGFNANLELALSALGACVFVGCCWFVATSRRDTKAFAHAAAGEGPELVGEYVIDARRIAALVIAMLAILAAEIVCSLIV